MAAVIGRFLESFQPLFMGNIQIDNGCFAYIFYLFPPVFQFWHLLCSCVSRCIFKVDRASGIRLHCWSWVVRESRLRDSSRAFWPGPLRGRKTGRGRLGGEEEFGFGQTVFTVACGLCGRADEPGFHGQSLPRRWCFLTWA